MKINVVYRYYKTVEVDDKFEALNDIYNCSDEYLQLLGELQELLELKDENYELCYVCDENSTEPIFDDI